MQQNQQGKLDEALKSYRDGLAITQRLAKSAPGWQSELSDIYASIADAYEKVDLKTAGAALR
jgi:exonuclease VII small subunit